MPSNLHRGDQEDAQGETRRAQAGSEVWRPKERHRSHAHESNCAIDWDGARVKRSSMTGYWQSRTIEAMDIKLSEKTMNLDGGLQLPTIWNPVLNPPWPTLGLSRVCPSRPMPPHPMIIIIITFYQYSLSLIIIIAHDLSPVTSSKTLPPLLWRHGCCIYTYLFIYCIIYNIVCPILN